MNQITYIRTGRLSPHPRNPRKELGDVSELAESIRVNGVLQNLTVVPTRAETSGQPTGHYTVVIGHRRLAAAKLAGLESVPCIISDMDETQQLRTMLTENMQRSDLTVYEQAQGFQLMLDLGDTPAQISERTGFSAATVRRRVKLLELDEKGFKKACERGATLLDFAKLDNISDPAARNAVLLTVGTQNFDDRLKAAIDQQDNDEYLDEVENAVKQWAMRLDENDVCPRRGEGYVIVSLDRKVDSIKTWTIWDSKSQRATAIMRPDDAGKTRYYYARSPKSISLYEDCVEKVKTVEELSAERKKAAYEARVQQAMAIYERHHDLREEFVLGFTACKTHREQIETLAIYGMANSATCAATDPVRRYLEIKERTAYLTEDRIVDRIEAGIKDDPLKLMLVMAYAAVDYRVNSGYAQSQWSGERGYQLVNVKNKNLDMLYALLSSLGYRMSDEERAMADGTHEVFKEEEGANE